jgi:spore coat protein U-like protein
MHRNIVAPIAAGIVLALSSTAHADSKNASFTVSATVAKTCAISAGNLDMDVWSGVNDLTGTSNVSVKCSTGTGYSVALSTGASSSFADRKLVNGTDLLSYNLYRDSGRSEVWGDGSNSTYVVGGTGTGMADAQNRAIPVYAKILEADLLAAKPGTYSNTITATVTY